MLPPLQALKTPKTSTLTPWDSTPVRYSWPTRSRNRREEIGYDIHFGRGDLRGWQFDMFQQAWKKTLLLTKNDSKLYLVTNSGRQTDRFFMKIAGSDLPSRTLSISEWPDPSAPSTPMMRSEERICNLGNAAMPGWAYKTRFHIHPKNCFKLPSCSTGTDLL